jgi:stearoyl-CoA desaturase (delta-9 desaturase)
VTAKETPPSERAAPTDAAAPPSSLAASSGRVELAWLKTAWLYANLVFGLAALPTGLTARSFAASFVLAFLTLCVGHSVGLHRGVIHKTYATSRPVRWLLALLFAFSGLGGPISWLKVHYTRDYWQNREDAPRYFRYDHGIVTDYHWNMHCRFVPAQVDLYGIPTEDTSDPFLRFLERAWMVFPVTLAALLAWRFGWAFAGVTCGLRVVGGIFGHWFVGYVSHKIGYVRYAVDGASAEGRNVFFLGVVSFGEGFHNNHHAYPSSARMGVKWYELDLGWWVVRMLELVGVVRDVTAWHRPGFHAKATASAVDPRFIFRNPDQHVASSRVDP